MARIGSDRDDPRCLPTSGKPCRRPTISGLPGRSLWSMGTCAARSAPTSSAHCSCSAARRPPISPVVSSGAFDQPSVAWPTFTPGDRADGETPEGLRALVFQHCEFGASEQRRPITRRVVSPPAPASHRLAAAADPGRWPDAPRRPPRRVPRADHRPQRRDRALRLARRPGNRASRLHHRPRRAGGRRPSRRARRLGADTARSRGHRAPGTLARRGRFASFVLDRQRLRLLVQDRAWTRRRRLHRRRRR